MEKFQHTIRGKKSPRVYTLKKVTGPVSLCLHHLSHKVAQCQERPFMISPTGESESVSECLVSPAVWDAA